MQHIQTLRSKQKNKRWVFTILGLFFVFLLLFPFIWMIVTSLETPQQIFHSPPYLIPPSPTFAAYKEAWSSQSVHIFTSLIISIGTVIFSVIISLPAAYALSHFKFRITPILLFCLLITQMIPNVMTANPFFIIFHKVHLLNSYAGIILADSTGAITFNILMLRAFFQTIPYELMEASLVDGAGYIRAFLKVIVPVSIPAIITAALFSFIFSWGDFLYALTLMTKNNIEPITLSIYQYIGEFTNSWNTLMATAVLAAIPAVILLIVSQKFITEGLVAGSIKG